MLVLWAMNTGTRAKVLRPVGRTAPELYMRRHERIEEQVPVGSDVVFTLRDGTAARGILTETDPEMVTLRPHVGHVECILIDAVVHWKVLRLPEAVHQLSTAVNSPSAPEPLANKGGSSLTNRSPVIEMPNAALPT